MQPTKMHVVLKSNVSKVGMWVLTECHWRFTFCVSRYSHPDCCNILAVS